MIAIFFFVSQNEKEKDSKSMREEKGKIEEKQRERKGNERSSTNTPDYVSICKCVCDMSQTVASISERSFRRER